MKSKIIYSIKPADSSAFGYSRKTGWFALKLTKTGKVSKLNPPHSDEQHCRTANRARRAVAAVTKIAGKAKLLKVKF